MDLGLTDRAAFVAGASSGLGLAVVRQLMLEGARVAMCSRNRDRIEEAAETVARETGAAPERLLPLTCDVTSETAVENAIDAAATTFGGLNILITNAGGPPSGGIDDLNAFQWRGAIELNLMSTINLCRAAVPHLRRAAGAENGFARILMISSISAKQPITNLHLSNTARAGVQGFAKSLAEELGPEGITVNTVLPGYTRTDRLVELAASINERTGRSVDEIEAAWATDAALKRIADPEEFAAAAVFLVSSRASYITGTALPVDGGRSKHLL